MERMTFILIDKLANPIITYKILNNVLQMVLNISIFSFRLENIAALVILV